MSAYQGAQDQGSKQSEALKACESIKMYFEEDLPATAKEMMEGNEEYKVEHVAPDRAPDDPILQQLIKDTAKEQGIELSEMDQGTAMTSVQKFTTYQAHFHAGQG